MMPSLLALGWLALAWADPSPARQCADAAEGREIEVCLRLAADHPADVEWVSAALKALVDQSSAPDRDLLVALLLLLDDATGIEGAKRLGDLRDPRAALPLVHVARDRELPVAEAAVAALATTPGGGGALADLLVDPKLKLPVRQAVVVALASLDDAAGADTLVDALRRRGLPAALRTTIRTTVLGRWPERSEELDKTIERDGALWLAAAGAGALGYSLGAAGHFGQTDLSGLGIATGVLAGGSLGYVGAKARPLEAAEASFIATSGAVSTAGGVLIGVGVQKRLGPEGLVQARLSTGDIPWLVGLGGAVIGYGASGATRKAWKGRRVGDSLEASVVAGIVGFSAGSGAVFFGERPELAAGIGLQSGIALGQIVAPVVDLTKADIGTMVLTSAWGGTLGALLPVEQNLGALAMAFGGVGALAGYGLAGSLQMPPDVLLGGFAGLGYGAFVGLGVGQIVWPQEGRFVRGVMLGGAVTGTALGLWLTGREADPIDDRDVVLTAAVTGFAAWQSVGWAGQLKAERRGWGVAFLAPAVAGALVAVASPEIDMPIEDSLATLSIGAWGGFAGGTIGIVADKPWLPWALVGSDVGIVGGVILLSPLVDTPPLVVGIADAGGVLVGAIAGIGTGLATQDDKPILTATLIGAGVGFAGGAVLGTVVHRSGRTRNLALFRPPRRGTSARVVVVPTAVYDSQLRAVPGGLIEVSGW